MGIEEVIKEIRDLREYDEKMEQRVEKSNQLKNKIDLLSAPGAKLALKYLVNRLDCFDDLIVAIELGEEV